MEQASPRLRRTHDCEIEKRVAIRAAVVFLLRECDRSDEQCSADAATAHAFPARDHGCDTSRPATRLPIEIRADTPPIANRVDRRHAPRCREKQYRRH